MAANLDIATTYDKHQSPAINIAHQPTALLPLYIKLKALIISVIRQFAINLSFQRPVIYYWIGANIIIYNPIKKKKQTIKLTKAINLWADCISYVWRIYVMGGNLINDVYEVDTVGKTLAPKQPMKTNKFGHSLCIASKYIYSIGGFNKSVQIADCEKYDIVNNQWQQLPNLLAARQQSAAFAFHNIYVYCFCGISYNVCMQSMERLKIGEKMWTNVSVRNCIPGRFGIVGLQYNDAQAIVFGGHSNGRYYADAYFLNIKEAYVDCKKASNLVEGGIFYYSSAPVMVNKVIYGVDDSRRIHIFANSKWQIIK